MWGIYSLWGFPIHVEFRKRWEMVNSECFNYYDEAWKDYRGVRM